MSSMKFVFIVEPTNKNKPEHCGETSPLSSLDSLAFESMEI
jgi:hypothetical protein